MLASLSDSRLATTYFSAMSSFGRQFTVAEAPLLSTLLRLRMPERMS